MTLGRGGNTFMASSTAPIALPVSISRKMIINRSQDWEWAALIKARGAHQYMEYQYV
jgi:glutamine synthetase adenylyltransferase